jgi:hypothetical protein
MLVNLTRSVDPSGEFGHDKSASEMNLISILMPLMSIKTWFGCPQDESSQDPDAGKTNPTFIDPNVGEENRSRDQRS